MVVLAAALLLTRLLTRDVAVTSKIAVEPACAKQWSDEMLENGRVATEPAGAPRQTYEGFKFNTSDPYLFITGLFFPFSQDRLNELYPTHRVYVRRVRRAADRLLRERLIVKADRDE